MNRQPVERILAWWKQATPRQRWMAGAGLLSSAATSTLLLVTGSSPASGTYDAGSAGFYWMAFARLFGVLLLIVGIAVVVNRRFGGRRMGKAQGQLQVVESLRLSPRQALHLVKVGEQYFLVGGTDQGLNLISAVQLDLPVSAAGAVQPVEFGSVLAGMISSLPQAAGMMVRK